MNYNTHTLANGLRVIHLNDGAPVVYCGYGVGVGTRHEQPEEHGMAHFCEHTAFKGTARRSSLQILNCLESVGGELNAFTNKEDTVYYAALLKDHLPRAVDLLTDMVFHSEYPQAELDKEIEVICDEIESYNDSPSELIYDEMENIIFSGHPLGHNILGTANQLRTYTTAHARSFAQRHYLPANAVFFAYGDISFKRLISLLERATADLTTSEGKRSAILLNGGAMSSQPLPPSPTAQEITMHRNTHQAHVLIGTRGYSTHDPRRTALFLLNNMMGGPGMNARLSLVLRERHGLVYTADSSTVNYSDTGLWAAYFGCDPKDSRRCRRLVSRELDRMRLRPVSAARLAAAKRQLKGQLSISCDNRENFALSFCRTFLHHNKGRDLADLFNRIDSVTAAELQATACDIFDPNKLTTLLYI